MRSPSGGGQMQGVYRKCSRLADLGARGQSCDTSTRFPGGCPPRLGKDDFKEHHAVECGSTA